LKELAEQLKKEFEKENCQSIYRTSCKCGRFCKTIMSNYVAYNYLYAIIYCSRCNKFYFHSGSVCLEVWGETTYASNINEIEYNSERWEKAVKQIKTGKIFV
jgi:hypothetical protein